MFDGREQGGTRSDEHNEALIGRMICLGNGPMCCIGDQLQVVVNSLR